MAEGYTPSEGDIRGRHAAGWLSRGWPETTEIDAEFDRWLAAHDARVRREAKAVGVAAAVAALRSLARSYEGVDPGGLGVSYGDVLNDAARRIEREGRRS
jgi:hypothetical protein